MLTSQQLAAIKADILANGDLNSKPNTPDGAFAIADLYALAASPDFIVWRSLVREQEITTQVSPEITTWSWTIFINRTAAEREGWARLFNGTYTVNPSLPQVQQAFLDIFSGSPGLPQRTHLAAMCKRKATRIEKLLATGTGSLVSPATMGFEGNLSYTDILQARAS